MNARKSLIFVLPLIALVLMACRVGNVSIRSETVQGSGTITTEERQVSGVERVALEDMGDLTIVQGDEEGLTIEADDNLLRYIETDMRGSELVIGIQDGIRIRSDNPIRYTLMVRNLDRISVSGSGNIEADSLEAQELALEVSGSGNMNFADLTATDLSVRASGSGNFDLSGSVETQEITISGSGNYTAGDLESSRADVTITGAGNVTVWVHDELDIRISGFGNVTYFGQPQVSQNITGGGEVRSRGEK